MDGGQVVEHKPVIPHIRFPNLVSDAEFPPAPVDVAEVAKRLKGAAVIQLSGSAELFISTGGPPLSGSDRSPRRGTGRRRAAHTFSPVHPTNRLRLCSLVRARLENSRRCILCL